MARKIGMFEQLWTITGSPEPVRDWPRPERDKVLRLWNANKINCAVDLLTAMSLAPMDWSTVEKSKITRRLRDLRLGIIS